MLVHGLVVSLGFVATLHTDGDEAAPAFIRHGAQQASNVSRTLSMSQIVIA